LERQSSDLTTAAALKLFDSEGNEITLGDNEYIRLTHLNLFMENVVDQLDVFDDIDDNGSVDEGERIVTTGANTGGTALSTHSVPFPEDGQRLSRGRRPKALAAAAGTVVVTGSGSIHTAGSDGVPSWKAQFGQ
jgi:hypothetical protein